jgi:ClpP class serine protease
MTEQWQPRGLLMASPKALGMVVAGNPSPANVITPALACVYLRGPIEHHASALCDSYDAYKERHRVAAASEARCGLLQVDSPGGFVSGCLDTVSEVREIWRAAGKPLIGYVDGEACSAAYAQLMACDYIFVPPTGVVGSIGTTENLPDVTQADAMAGVKVHVVMSGDRKADYNPHVAKTPEALAAVQGEITEVAKVFWGVVSASRGISSEQVRSYQARSLIGQAAIEAGLADAIATEDQVIAMLTRGEIPVRQVAAMAEKVSKPMGFAEAMAAMQAVVEDEGTTPEDKEKARKCISHMNTAPKMESEEAPKKDDDAPPAKHDEPDGDEGKKALRVAKNAEEYARAALLASRSDFTPEQVKTLSKLPFEAVREAVQTWPRAQASSTVADAMSANSARSSKAAAAVVPVGSEPQMALSKEGASVLAQLDERLGIDESDLKAARRGKRSEDGYWEVPSLTVREQNQMIKEAKAPKAARGSN